MRNDTARKICDSVKLRDVMEFYGVRFNSRGFAMCPFHKEKTASLSIKNEKYKCFGCGAYGGAIDFVMQYHGLKFTQAMVKIDSDWHLGLISSKPTYRDRVRETENRRIQAAEEKIMADKQAQYFTLCQVHSILFGRLVNGEEWLREMIENINMILDDYTGEEARAWKMAMMKQKYTTRPIS